MATTAKTIVNDNVSPSKVILTLAWPVFIEQILTTLVQSVDTAMVGSLGASATASVSISVTPMMLINGIVMSFGIGFTALIARCVGAQDYERANSLTRQAMSTVLLLGIPLAVICYVLSRAIPRWMGAKPDVVALATGYNKIMALSMVFRTMTMVLTAIYRGYGDTKTPMFINTGINRANVVGNYILIYEPHQVSLLGRTFDVWGAGWGVNGAAASSTITAIAGSILLIIITLNYPGRLRISFKDSFRLQKKDMADVTKISLPAMFERFTMGGASIVIASTVASLGTIAIASNSLASTAESFCYMPGFAFSAAATTLMGQSLGARRVDMARKYVSTAIKLASGIMLVMSVCMFLFANPIIKLFTPDAQVIEMGGVLLKLLALIQVPYIISMVHSGALRGAGDTKGPFYITLLSMWGVRVLGATICVRLLGLGIYSVIVCMDIDNVLRMFLFRHRLNRGEWKMHHM